MVVQAMFVASSIARFTRGGSRNHDLIIVVPGGHADSCQREFAAAHDIVIDDSMPLDAIGEFVLAEGRLTNATLMKLLLPQHYAFRYDKILYLDADLAIHHDVSVLFGLDMGDCPLAAVGSGRILSDLRNDEADKVRAHFAALGMTAPYRFFNSGVMLMQTSRWLEARITERALDYLRRNPELCELPDEHALNAVLDGEFLPLSAIWNASPRRFWAHNLVPTIIHYSGDNKPWKRFSRHKRPGSQRQGYALYREFTNASPWPGFLRSQWRVKDLVGSLLCEVEHWWRSLALRFDRGAPDRSAFAKELKQYYAETSFVDVEQGIATRDGDTIRCAVSSKAASLGRATP
jgi:lipopolysaccharide biosynthesis glycosyltransferase